jgi:hypothetical protein
MGILGSTEHHTLFRISVLLTLTLEPLCIPAHTLFSAQSESPLWVLTIPDERQQELRRRRELAAAGLQFSSTNPLLGIALASTKLR